jgi:hypothetical protein
MRRLLVRRFESSIPAFRSTLQSMIGSMERIQNYAVQAGKIPIYKKGEVPDVESVVEGSGDYKQEELNELLERLASEKDIWFLPSKELIKAYFADLQKDIALLRNIYHQWFLGDAKPDPKCEYIMQKIQDELARHPERKIALFTEYADTAEYLYAKFSQRIPCFLYTSKHASEQNKQIIKNEFDAGLLRRQNKQTITPCSSQPTRFPKGLICIAPARSSITTYPTTQRASYSAWGA